MATIHETEGKVDATFFPTDLKPEALSELKDALGSYCKDGWDKVPLIKISFNFDRKVNAKKLAKRRGEEWLDVDKNNTSIIVDEFPSDFDEVFSKLGLIESKISSSSTIGLDKLFNNLNSLSAT